jgi:hypothetical protein
MSVEGIISSISEKTRALSTKDLAASDIGKRVHFDTTISYST